MNEFITCLLTQRPVLATTPGFQRTDGQNNLEDASRQKIILIDMKKDANQNDAGVADGRTL